MRVTLQQNRTVRTPRTPDEKPTYSTGKTSRVFKDVIRVAHERIPQSGRSLLHLECRNGPQDCIALGVSDYFVVEEDYVDG